MDIPSHNPPRLIIDTNGDGCQEPRVSGARIGASHRPAHLMPLSKKGVANLYTGGAGVTQEDDGMLSISPSQTTLTSLHTPMGSRAHDSSHHYDDFDSGPIHRPGSLSHEGGLLFPKASSPISISYSSSPETPLSFHFSPNYHCSGLTDSQSSYFPNHMSGPTHHLLGLTRHNSVMTDMTEGEPLSWPSTSYASSSKVPSSFPFHDHMETDIKDIKGKGKERERRSPSPSLAADLPPASESQVHRPDPEALQGTEPFPTSPLSIDAMMRIQAVENNVGSQPSSVDSVTGLRHRRSHIGLSFSEQRFTPSPTHSRRQTSFSIGRGRRRSRSAHSHRRSPTPVPARSHSPHERSTMPRRKRSSFRKLLSIARRGRSSRRERSPSRRASTAESAPAATAVVSDNREHLNISLEPVTAPLEPSLPPSPLIPSVPQSPDTSLRTTEPTSSGRFRQGEVVEDGSSEAGNSSTSGSTTIRWSTLAASISIRPEELVEEEDEEETGDVVITSSAPGPTSTSILVSGITPFARSDSPEVLLSPPLPGVSEAPSSASSARPPRLKFVGRANTSPSVPQAEVSSTVASGSSASPTSAYCAKGASAVSSATSRPHSNSVLTSVSGPETSAAFTYIHTLPPLTRLVPQPDGCGQVLEDSGSISPAHAPLFSSSVMSKVHPPDFFGTILPYELQVEVLRTLLQLHVGAHESLVASERWSFGVATGMDGANAIGGKKQRSDSVRWVGFERGVRELVKLGRVSRQWRVLSLDGQLWATTSFSNFPQVPVAFLQRITKSVGPFMKTLDLRGVTGITGAVMINLVDNVRSVREGLTLEHDGDESDEEDAVSERPETPYGVRQPPAICPSSTQLTSIQLQGCSAIPTRSLHALLSSSPFVEYLSLKGLPSVTNATCELIGMTCSATLVNLDLGKCGNISANGIEDMVGVTHNAVSFKSFSVSARPRYPIPARRFPKLKELKLSGLKRITGQTMFLLGWGIPDLEVLDVSGARTLGDDDLEVFVRWDERFDDVHVLNGQVPPSRKTTARKIDPYGRVTLTSREMGFNPMSTDKYHRRLTKLRHLSLSCCPLLTDAAVGHLAHSVPKLEYFEMGGVGAGVHDVGLVRLFATTRWIRRVDLDDASEITDASLHALIPPPPPPLVDQRRRDVDYASGRATAELAIREPEPGELLEQIVLSYAGHLTDAAFLAMIQGCTKLKVMEVDNTRASDQVIKEFVKACRRRQVHGAEILAVDCRNVTRSVFSEGTGSNGFYLARNRRGYRAWEAKDLAYYDERDKKDVTSGLDVLTGTAAVGDECDESRVVVKTFHSWQAVDNMVAAREKRKKALAARKAVGTGTGDSTPSSSSSGADGGRAPRWLHWRSSGAQTPLGGVDMEGDDRGCIIM